MKGLAEKISKYLEEKKMSQRQFATAAAVNAAFVSQILNGKPVSEVVERKVSAFLEGRKVSGIYETEDFKKALKHIRIAHKHKMMIAIVGETGVGKTTALKYYAKRANAFYIRADKSLTANQMIMNLAQELGIQHKGTVSEIMRACCKRLNQLSNPVVLVDECGKIKPLQLMYLQELRDNTEENCAIILAGMPYFFDRMQEGAKTYREGYPEMFSRIQLWVRLNGLSNSEITAILEAEGVTPQEIHYKSHLFRVVKSLIFKEKEVDADTGEGGEEEDGENGNLPGFGGCRVI